MSCNTNTVHISENVENKVCNLQIRLAKFTRLMEKAENNGQLELNFPKMMKLISLKH